MNALNNIIKSTTAKALLLLISVSIIFYPNCSGSRIDRISEPPDQFSVLKSSEDLPFLKLHMKNGDLYVLENWKMNTTQDSITGTGKLLDLNREITSQDKFNVPLKKIVLAETNQISGSAAAGALTTLTIISGIFTIVCITNPKACFGSCPTFYAHNGYDYIVQSEGFSSSISPALEERDVDALYRIKPLSEDFEVQLKNEAYETHIIRSANILAAPKPEGGRVFATQDGKYLQAINISEASSVTATEGDISEKLCSFDGVERFCEADSTDLAAKETIEVIFYGPTSDSMGIVIAARQTLLTTFLFYQTLSYMGTTTGDWLANMERNGNQFKVLLENPRSVLGNIDVLMQNDGGEWEKVAEVGETGPIATDIKIVPLTKISNCESDNSSIKVKLRMAKGLWRIDYIAIADIMREVTPEIIFPSTSSPEFLNNSSVTELLANTDSVLVTFPGDKYFLNYNLPTDYKNYEFFIETQGYYLEWMRNEWLGEENPGKVYQMLLNPEQFYKDLAPQFKKVEAEMEETFWSSKYVYP
jgi:hypothetical protein